MTSRTAGLIGRARVDGGLDFWRALFGGRGLGPSFVAGACSLMRSCLPEFRGVASVSQLVTTPTISASCLSYCSSLPASCLRSPDRDRAPQLLSTLSTIGVDPNGGVIVNLGAALVHPGPNQASANDDAWNLFFAQASKLNLTIKAFEGSPRALADNERAFNETGGRFELRGEKRARATLVNEFADPFTLVHKLHQVGVPRRFMLLKIDIDSVDYHAFDVITSSFRPSLVIVEKAVLREGLQPTNVAFAALKRPTSVARPYDGTELVLPPRRRAAFPCCNRTRPQSHAANKHGWSAGEHLCYECIRGFNPWAWVPCEMSDSKSWFSLAARRGYAVVQAEAGKNLILVRSEHKHLFPHVPCESSRMHAAPVSVSSTGALATTSPTASTELTPGVALKRLLGGLAFVEHVELRCAQDGREYTLAVDGVCCPTRMVGPLGDVQLSLPRCVCLDTVSRGAS